jgi:hypothetical protein
MPMCYSGDCEFPNIRYHPMLQTRTHGTYLCGRNDKFCGGLPTDNGMPRIACPLARSTLVIGSDNGRELEHAAITGLICTSCRKLHASRPAAIVKRR